MEAVIFIGVIETTVEMERLFEPSVQLAVII